MPRRNQPRHAVQLDLFRPASREPVWRSLPLQAREDVRLLLARMLRMASVPTGVGETERAASDE